MANIQMISRAAATGTHHHVSRLLSSWAGKVIREPLLHFLFLGAILFMVWAVFGDRFTEAPGHIVISSGQMARSIDTFARTHLRPPDKDELQTLIDQEIQDEVYFREGMALGLDRNDEIIRRRIRQKMLFLTQDIADRQAPGDAELRIYFDQHRTDYGQEPNVAFSQIYLNPDQHKDIAADAVRLLAKLNDTDGRIDYAANSDTLPVSNDFEATPSHVIAAIFGREFAAALSYQPLGKWAGPIRSGYGLHLVLIRERQQPKPPSLAHVHDAVLTNWQADRRLAVNEAAYRQMRSKYKVSVDMPKMPIIPVTPTPVDNGE